MHEAPSSRALDFHARRILGAQALAPRLADHADHLDHHADPAAGHDRQECAIDGPLRARIDHLTAGSAANKWLLYLLALELVLVRHADVDDPLIATPAPRDPGGAPDAVLYVRAAWTPETSFKQRLGALRRELEEANLHRAHDPDALLRRLAAAGCREEVAHDVALHHAAIHGDGASLGPFRLRFEVDVDDRTVALVSRRDLLGADAARRLLRHLLRALDHVTRAPGDVLGGLDLLGADELALWRDWNAPVPGDIRAPSLVAAFAAQVRARPDACALACEGERMSYAELDARANRVAHALRGMGVGPEVVVAIRLERSLAMVVAILGALKAGGVYLPIDPAYPPQRQSFMLRDARAAVLVTAGAPALADASILADTLATLDLDAERERLAALPAEAPRVDLGPEHAAYIIYTSGSTGQPKGVCVRHGNVLALFAAADTCFALGPDDVWTLFHSFAFDFSVWELWGALLYGGRVVVVPHWVARAPADFHALLQREGVTVLSQTPSAFRPLVAWDAREDAPEAAASPLALRYVVFGGEALDPGQLAPWIARRGDERPQLINMYGITETTVHVTFHRVRAHDRHARSIIGRPLPGWRVYLLDRAGMLVPPGVAGEIHVAGLGLARGYVDRPELTAERFVAGRGHLAGERLYRSGDRARLLPDGRLEYLGRVDHQLKIRGFRIEAGEIEAAIARHPAVRRACVIGHGREDRQLVAYVEREAAVIGDAPGAVADEQVDQWREIYDGLYAGDRGAHDPTFDIAGWNSSFTRAPLPAADMRAWVEHTVARIVAHAPRRVLEIGCGTGLLLHRIAPRVERYLATDLSRAAVDALALQLRDRPAMRHVELRCGAAHALAADDERFDVVILNSVVQYFPDQAYLARVLDDAVARVAPGGLVFIGDVRDHTTLAAFHLAVARDHRPDATSDDLRAELRERVAHEEELTVDPAFFLDLPRRDPRVREVRPLLKRGGYDNELMRFRYDVLVRVGGPAPAPAPVVWDWQQEALTLAALARRLADERPGLALVERVPNRHVVGHLAALDALQAGASAQQLRARAGEREAAAPRPDELRALARDLPYAVELCVGGEPEHLRVVLRRHAINSSDATAATDAEGRGIGVELSPRHRGPVFTNTPIAGELDGRLARSLRTLLARTLPDYMLPASFVVLPALPTLPNGKIDRAALPDPTPRRRGAAAYLAPATPREATLAGVWQEVLGVERVGARDNFFELGGDSIRGIRVVQRARAAGVALSVRDLFAHPTVAELAALDEQRPDDAVAPPLAPFALLGPADRAAVPDDIADAYPLTRLQAGMVFHSLFGREDALYHDILAFDLRLACDDAALRGALERQIERHHVLRTSFHVRDFSEPLQLVHARVAAPLTIDDASACDGDEQDARFDRMFADDRARGFELERAPLFRLHVLRRGADRLTLTLSFHHAILDGWSAATLLTDLVRDVLAASGRAAPSPVAVGAHAYRDYVALERRSAAQAATQRYWAEQLRGAEPLRIRRLPGPTTAHSALGVVDIALGDEHSAALERVADIAGAPLQHVMLAAHAKVLAMVTGRADLLLGVVHNGRLEVEGGDRMLGLFLNTPILRARPAPGSWVDLVRQIARDARELLPHRRFPLAQMHAILGERSAFDIYFNYTHFHVLGDAVDELGIDARAVRSFARTNFPLALIVEKDPRRARLGLLLKYDTSRYPAAQVEALAAAYREVLAAMASRPADRHDQFHIAAAASARHVAAFTAPIARDIEGSVLDDLERNVAARPHAVAVEHPGGPLTYAELGRRVATMAAELHALGVRDQALVVVALGGGLRQLVAMLATFRAGGVYMPLRLHEPALRWQRMTRRAPPALLLIAEEDADGIEARVDHLAARPTIAVADDHGLRRIVSAPGHDPRALPRGDDLPAPPRPRAEQANYIFFTSGSTGEPKAILGNHGSLRQFIRWEIDEFRLDARCRVGQVARVQFDAYLRETLVALSVGGTLVIPDDETRNDIDRLLLWIGASRLTLIHSVPSVMRLLLKAGEHAPAGLLAALERYIMGGEPLGAEDIRGWRARFGAHTELVNIYGTTETTCIKTFYRVGALDLLLSPQIPAGGPMAGAALAVLDGARACLPGEVGEVYLKSPYMTLGYYGDPELTARMFVQNPLVAAPDIVYRTGDLGRILPDGNLELLGRIDDQIKRNGVRIELGEIDEALRGQPGVRETLVAADRSPAGAVVVTAYFTGAAAPDELQRALRRALPGYLMPNHLVQLEAFPLLPGGKVDRAALPRPAAQLHDEHRRVARSEWESHLGEVFREVLGLRGARDLAFDVPFFELGGDSLLAMQLVARIHRVFGVTLPLREVFAHPSVAAMAVRIAGRRPIAQRPIAPRPPADHHPTSNAQRRLWVLHHLEEGATGYHIREAHRLRGAVDVAAFQRAHAELIARHEVLRTTFLVVDDELRQVVHPADAPAAPRLVYRDLRAEPPTPAAVNALVERLVHAPFDLVHGPLLRAELLHLADDELVLVTAMHHIITDAESIAQMRRELVAALTGRPCEAPAIQHRDYAAWQAAWLASPDADAARDHWLARFTPPPPPLDLPTDRPRSPGARHRGATRREALDRDVVERLRGLGHAHGATLFMTVLALLEVLLHRYTGQTDLTVGTPSSGRTHPDLAGQLGFFVNTLALRTRLDPDRGFDDALRRVARTCVEAFEHREYPFDRLVEGLDLERDLTRHPLFDVMFTLTGEDAQGDALLPGVSAEPLPLPPRDAQLDLSIHLIEQAGGAQVLIDHDPALLSDERVARMWRHLCALMADVLAHPTRPLAELELLPPAELAEIHARARPDDEDLLPAEDLLACFARQVAARPDAVAIEDGERATTYRELDELAARMAAVLATRCELGPERFVALHMARSSDYVAALLAVLRCGAAFVPIDVAAPPARVAATLRDAGCCLLVHDRVEPPPVPAGAVALHVHALRAAAAATTPAGARPVDPEQAAYVIYTSGSTGEPKGAVIRRQSLANLCACYGRRFGLDERARVTHGNSIGFDVSLVELLPTLTHGGRVLVLPEDLWHDPTALAAYVRAHGVTHLDLPTVICEQLADPGAPALPPELVVTTGGDALRRAETRSYRVINVYGLSEASVVNTAADLLGRDPADAVPIGRPINGTRVYLLDAALRPVPVGLPGELCLVGPSLARGYLNRPTLTAERFVTSPFLPGERLYRTGDSARFRLHDGQLEFLGRIDAQVQIRGYRVELGEIEAALARHPDVADACVITVDDHDGRPKLVGYVTGEDPPAEDALHRHLRATLPHYMVPSRILRIDAIPLNASGKRLLAALPRPDDVAPARREPPATDTETRVLELWQQVLGVEGLGVEDNFFRVGGYSLRAMSLVALIHRELGVAVPLALVYEAPTVRGLSVYVERARELRIDVPERPYLRLGAGGEERALFLFPPALGSAVAYAGLAEQLPGVALYAFNYVPDDATLARHAALIDELQPRGPLALLGHSAGGFLALLMARALEARGREVSSLILLDTFRGGREQRPASAAEVRAGVDEYLHHPGRAELRAYFLQSHHLRERAYRQVQEYFEFLWRSDLDVRVGATIHLVRAEENHRRDDDWPAATRRARLNHLARGAHRELLEPPHLATNAALLRAILES